MDTKQLLARRAELLRERNHWLDKLQNQRMRYIKWLRISEPIDKELREINDMLWELWINER